MKMRSSNISPKLEQALTRLLINFEQDTIITFPRARIECKILPNTEIYSTRSLRYELLEYEGNQYISLYALIDGTDGIVKFPKWVNYINDSVVLLKVCEEENLIWIINHAVDYGNEPNPLLFKSLWI